MSKHIIDGHFVNQVERSIAEEAARLDCVKLQLGALSVTRALENRFFEAVRTSGTNKHRAVLEAIEMWTSKKEREQRQ